jgi:hypothetical protein
MIARKHRGLDVTVIAILLLLILVARVESAPSETVGWVQNVQRVRHKPPYDEPGNLYIIRGRSSSLRPLWTKGNIYSGDLAGTDATSIARLVLNRGRSIHLAANSAVRLTRADTYECLNGKLWATLLPRSGLRTPAAANRNG